MCPHSLPLVFPNHAIQFGCFPEIRAFPVAVARNAAVGGADGLTSAVVQIIELVAAIRREIINGLAIVRVLGYLGRWVELGQLLQLGNHILNANWNSCIDWLVVAAPKEHGGKENGWEDLFHIAVIVTILKTVANFRWLVVAKNN